MKRLREVLFILALLGSGCATAPKIDWNSRVGAYTFDQAVIELGPPDKDAKLTDGMRVSEWLTHRGRGGTTYVSHWRFGAAIPMDTSTPDYYLRLTFDPTGKLQSWRKYTK